MSVSTMWVGGGLLLASAPPGQDALLWRPSPVVAGHGPGDQWATVCPCLGPGPRASWIPQLASCAFSRQTTLAPRREVRGPSSARGIRREAGPGQEGTCVYFAEPEGAMGSGWGWPSSRAGSGAQVRDGWRERCPPTRGRATPRHPGGAGVRDGAGVTAVRVAVGRTSAESPGRERDVPRPLGVGRGSRAESGSFSMKPAGKGRGGLVTAHGGRWCWCCLCSRSPHTCSHQFFVTGRALQPAARRIHDAAASQRSRSLPAARGSSGPARGRRGARPIVRRTFWVLSSATAIQNDPSLCPFRSRSGELGRTLGNMAPQPNQRGGQRGRLGEGGPSVQGPGLCSAGRPSGAVASGVPWQGGGGGLYSCRMWGALGTGGGGTVFAIPSVSSL